MAPEAEGYYSVEADDAPAGTLYRFLLDGEGPFADPASRFQPSGPCGPSMVIDPFRYRWRDRRWKGPTLPNALLYECHIGTLTEEGTWNAAEAVLPSLRDLGISILEVMPVAEFPGRFGWGYDGVNLFAPTRLYGKPDDLRRFVDRAHALGLGVVLDVVYNHFGPDGCHLRRFSPTYFSADFKTEWGEGLNFDGPGSRPVREFFSANATLWIQEYHLDGLRIDATQAIRDGSDEHILGEIVSTARRVAEGRTLFMVGENEPQDCRLVRPPEDGGQGLDALWNDDFHHSARVALTGKREAYYTDYRGSPQEFISLCKWGFLFQGQYYAWQQKGRGTPALGLEASSYVTFLENHDQVANTAFGRRLWQECSPGDLRALTALLLLAPPHPMLFQGQEIGSKAPFLYFADHGGDLARLVTEGRCEFLSQFHSVAAIREQLPDPCSPESFQRSKLADLRRQAGPEFWDLHHDLIALRRTDPTISAARSSSLHGAVLGPSIFVLRFDDDRLLLVNLGADEDLRSVAEPLMAAPAGGRWRMIWSTESPRYGGSGTQTPWRNGSLYLPGHSALVAGG